MRAARSRGDGDADREIEGAQMSGPLRDFLSIFDRRDIADVVVFVVAIGGLIVALVVNR